MDRDHSGVGYHSSIAVTTAPVLTTAGYRKLCQTEPCGFAGLRGDIIVSAGGKATRTVSDLREAVNSAGIGGRLELTVYRDGRTFNVTVNVSEAP